MSTILNSISYQFKPDKETQALCESIANDINGNGVSLTDITALSASTQDFVVTTQFNWQVKVSIKHSIVSTQETKDSKRHNTIAEAKAAVKQQGQHILQKSLGKIELIQNISDDPEHFYKHSTIKLNGGQTHAYVESCNAHCDRGQVNCPRCDGRGTHKAITKKEDLLGTTENFSAINTCPDCKGKGTIDCKSCAGSGEIMQLYSVHVDATRKHKNITDITNTSIKKAIEQFLSRQSHMQLFKHYLSPSIEDLKDIDKDHCNVIYQSKARYILLSISVKDKKYQILSFGKEGNCIAKPKILDDFLPLEIKKIIGKSHKLNSSRKYLKLHSLPIINLLLSNQGNRSKSELESLLKNKSNDLLSKQTIKTIVEKLTRISTSMIPRFSFYAWLPVVATGMVSGFYFSLKLNTTIELAVLSASHIVSVAVVGTILSKIITASKKKKLSQNTEVPTLEKLPIFISTALLAGTMLSTNLLTIEQRWLSYYTVQQKIESLQPDSNIDSEVISNPNLITIAQKYLMLLDYSLTSNGIYNQKTRTAVNDFQRKLGLEESKYLNQHTMRLLVKYAVLKEKSFTDKK